MGTLWRLCVVMVVTVWHCAPCSHIQLTTTVIKNNFDVCAPGQPEKKPEITDVTPMNDVQAMAEMAVGQLPQRFYPAIFKVVVA